MLSTFTDFNSGHFPTSLSEDFSPADRIRNRFNLKNAKRANDLGYNEHQLLITAFLFKELNLFAIKEKRTKEL